MVKLVDFGNKKILVSKNKDGLLIIGGHKQPKMSLGVLTDFLTFGSASTDEIVFMGILIDLRIISIRGRIYEESENFAIFKRLINEIFDD